MHDSTRRLICPHCGSAAALEESFGRYKYECGAYLRRDRQRVTQQCGFRGRYQRNEADARRVWLALYQDVVRGSE